METKNFCFHRIVSSVFFGGIDENSILETVETVFL